MAVYNIRIKASAAKEIERVEPREIRRLIVERIRALAENPRPPGCEKISGRNQLFRVRQGRYRIVYSIADEVLVVYVVKVGHRREVYRRM